MTFLERPIRLRLGLSLDQNRSIPEQRILIIEDLLLMIENWKPAQTHLILDFVRIKGLGLGLMHAQHPYMGTLVDRQHFYLQHNDG